MKLMITYSHDEIQEELPYEIIGETASRSIWETGKRKRLWDAAFSENEKEACRRIIRQAKSWLLGKGVPEEITMSLKTRELWYRLADLCFQL